MAQRLVTANVNTVIPGAYPTVTVTSQPVGLGASGILVIMGEADGGNSYQNVVLANNSFTPDQLALVQQQYISGQIVDAFAALSAPSSDANITATANLVYIVKTNQGTKASASVIDATSMAGTYGTIEDINWGLSGNNYQYQITQLATEAMPMVTGTTISSYGSLSGSSFTVRVNGGAAILVTLGGVITDVPSLVTSMNSAFSTAAVDLQASAGTAPNTVKINYSTTPGSASPVADQYANSEGWGKSFELIDSTPGDLEALGFVVGLYTSSQESEVEVQINNATSGLSETLDVVPEVCLMVGYQGTTATLTIADGLLTTTVTGGTGSNLSLTLSQYSTINALATYINSQAGYSATCAPAATQLATSALDSVNAIGICSTGTGDEPGRIKNAASAFQQVLATSTAVIFVPEESEGLPATTTAPIYLSGGVRGATAPADIVNALAQVGGIQCNIIVPLFSQDASEDIALGTTQSVPVASTYTIASINAAVKSHCLEYSTSTLKRNRICILSYWDDTESTYLNAKAQAQSLANYRCSLAMQQSMQNNSQGVVTTFMPWYTAVVAAGMQAGGFYKSITNKLANVISFIDPNGFDSGNPGDVEDGLSAGLLFLNAITGGNAWVSDQTTYSYDTNFVYNSIQAVYDSDLIALDLAASFTSAFVGQSLADVSAATALAYLGQKMNGYLRIKLIAPSDDAPLGYKNAKVTILAPTMTVYVEIKLATAIYFIPININISQVQQSA